MNRDNDRGSVTVFFAVAVAGLLVMVGLIVDGGTKITLLQRADDLAAQATRAGGQAVDPTTVLTGQTTTADPARAVHAAQAFLATNQATGKVVLDPNGRGLTVTVTLATSTVFLGLVGVDEITASGTSHARLVRSVTGDTS